MVDDIEWVLTGPGGSVDPIHQPFIAGFDHSFGDNSTGNGGGTTGNPLTFSGLTASKNVAQNSWNVGAALNDPGTYSFLFEAYGTGFAPVGLSRVASQRRLLASTSIDVIISAVPLPAALPLLLAGLGLLGFKGRRGAKMAA